MGGFGVCCFFGCCDLVWLDSQLGLCFVASCVEFCWECVLLDLSCFPLYCGLEHFGLGAIGRFVFICFCEPFLAPAYGCGLLSYFVDLYLFTGGVFIV